MSQLLPNQRGAAVAMGDLADEDTVDCDEDIPTIKSSAHNPTGKNQHNCSTSK